MVIRAMKKTKAGRGIGAESPFLLYLSYGRQCPPLGNTPLGRRHQITVGDLGMKNGDCSSACSVFPAFPLR